MEHSEWSQSKLQNNSSRSYEWVGIKQTIMETEIDPFGDPRTN